MLFLWAEAASATTWYVDNAATGLNNGTSWANAWTNFAPIATAVLPGDTVYISGGSVSKTYRGPLVTASGSAGRLVTIAVGQDPGHNGTVIFNVGEANWLSGPKSFLHITGEVNGKQRMQVEGFTNLAWDAGAGAANVRLSYLRFPNAPGGFYFYPSTPTKIELDHLYVYKLYSANHDNIIFLLHSTIAGFDQHLVHHNEFYIPVNAPGTLTGDDGIQWAQSASFYNNYFKNYVTNYPGSQHADVFQVKGSYLKVYNNVFEDSAQSIFYHDNYVAPAAFTGVYFYNNVVYQSRTWPAYHWIVDIQPEAGGVGSTFTDLIVANNTFVDMIDALWLVRFDNIAACTNCRIVNNIVRSSAGALTPCCGATASHNTASGDAVGFIRYQPFAPTTNNLHLSDSDKVARDRGTALSAPFNSDKDGVARPQGAGWDIGAFEFSDDLAPAPPTNLERRP